MLTIFGKNNCKWCERAKELAVEHKIEYEYRNVEENVQFLLELSALNPTAKTLPQIYMAGLLIGGCTDFEQWLNQ